MYNILRVCNDARLTCYNSQQSVNLQVTNPDPVPTPPPVCPTRCLHIYTDCATAGIPNGDYQICQSCFHYKSCQDGRTSPCHACNSTGDRMWQWHITSPTRGHCANSPSSTCNQCPLVVCRMEWNRMYLLECVNDTYTGKTTALCRV